MKSIKYVNVMVRKTAIIAVPSHYASLFTFTADGYISALDVNLVLQIPRSFVVSRLVK